MAKGQAVTDEHGELREHLRGATGRLVGYYDQGYRFGYLMALYHSSADIQPVGAIGATRPRLVTVRLGAISALDGLSSTKYPTVDAWVAHAGWDGVSDGTSKGRGRKLPPPPVAKKPKLDVREIAIKLYRVMGTEPHGSQWLAAKAGIKYSDVIIPILKKLKQAGKIRLESGRWARV